jgi:general stress protein 26
MATNKANPSDSDKAQQNFLEVLRSFDQAMMVTHGAETGLHARPMSIADTDKDGSIWFITGADTAKVYELQRDHSLLAVMQSSSKSLTVGGRGELIRDRAKIHEVWKETFRAWFDGKDDPNIALIRLNPVEAEYWDNSGLKGIKFALKVAAAVISGKELSHQGDSDVDTHAKLNL